MCKNNKKLATKKNKKYIYKTQKEETRGMMLEEKREIKESK
jgi:hypothetical protein